jgi:putative transcriptional regulator
MRPGLKVKLKRTEKEIQLQNLAKMVGISRYYLSALENGRATNPSAQVMKKISEALNCSVQELFF